MNGSGERGEEDGKGGAECKEEAVGSWMRNGKSRRAY